MSEIKDGGPAFGGSYDSVVVDTSGERPPFTLAARARGMSLRDYFAAKAMHAEIATSCSDATRESADTLAGAAYLSGMTVVERIAFNAYLMADAMLKARGEGR